MSLFTLGTGAITVVIVPDGCWFGGEVRFVPPGSPFADVDTSTVPNPLSAVVDEVEEVLAEIEGGWHQIVDPITCGLKGINPTTGKIGNCSPAQVERREDYAEAGGAVCKASRTPVVGSAIPDGDFRSWVAWELTEQGMKVNLATAAQGGVRSAGTALRASNYLSWAATAVDAHCRWAQP